MSEGTQITVQADDNAHVLLDFGDSRFGSITTGFTMQKYRGPAVELYGTEGVLQLMGDDWAPQGYEKWTNAAEVWEIHEESAPNWPWTAGLRHLVGTRRGGHPDRYPTEDALHRLGVMLVAQTSAGEGRHVAVESNFGLRPRHCLSANDYNHRRGDHPRQCRNTEREMASITIKGATKYAIRVGFARWMGSIWPFATANSWCWWGHQDAGKSTTLLMISLGALRRGILRARAPIDDADVVIMTWRAKTAYIAMVFQTYALYPRNVGL